MKLKLLVLGFALSLLFTSTLDLKAADKKAKKEASTEAPAKETKKATGKKVEDKKEESTGQCQATTKKGTQCSRKATDGKFCKQHAK